MATVSFEIPDEYLCTFEQTPEEFARAVRLAAAMFWYEREELSMGRGAEVAGIPYADFMMALAEAKIQNVAVDLDELRREFALQLGVAVGGTLKLVLAAKRAGMIPLARPVVDQLCEVGLYVADRIMNEALAVVGE